MKANEFFKKVGIDAVRSYLAAYEDDLTKDLKRLVESHELVQRFGGMDEAKKCLDDKIYPELGRAIKLMESCQ